MPRMSIIKEVSGLQYATNYPVAQPSAHVIRKQPRVPVKTNCERNAKPFLKWVGGKTQLLGELRKYYPPRFNAYFEPFIGGGAAFFDIRPQKAYLNDLNGALANAYRNIKCNAEEVISILRAIQDKYDGLAAQDRKEYYYAIRQQYNAMQDSEIRKTAYLVFLNKTCFNGMYRESSKGHFNVPFGRYSHPTILNESNIRLVSVALKNATITSGTFDNALKKAQKGDFIYLDPPYHPLSSTSNFTGYNEQRFLENEQAKLKSVFKELAERGCYVMLSNSYSEFIRELYAGYTQIAVMAHRAINCKAHGRGKIKELVVLSY